MAGDKIEHTFEIQEDAIKMLNEAVEKHNLESRDKALRCLLDGKISDVPFGSLIATSLAYPSFFAFRLCHSFFSSFFASAKTV